MAKTKEELESFWVDEFSRGDKFYKEKIKKRNEEYKSYFRGEQWNPTDLDMYNEPIVDNLVYENVSTIKPSININNPRLYVKAEKPPYRTVDGSVFNTVAGSFALEVLLNYWFRKLQVKGEISTALTDALTGFWGFVEVGYSFEGEKILANGRSIQVDSRIREDAPFVRAVESCNIRFDPRAKDHKLRDARWVAIKWVRSVEDVKKDPRFSNTSELSADTKIEDAYALNSDHIEDVDLVTGWDIWDKRDKKLLTLANDKLIRNITWPLDFENFPIKVLFFNDNPNSVIPISDVGIYKPLQDNLNHIESMQLDHVKRISSRIFLNQKNNLKPSEKDKLEIGKDGTIVDCEHSPSTSITLLRDAVQSQDITMVTNLIKQSIRGMAGTADFERGVARKFETATEPALINQGVNIRRADRTTVLEEFIVEIASELGRVIQQTIDEDKGQDIKLDETQFNVASQVAPGLLSKQNIQADQVERFGSLPKVVQIIGENQAQVLLPWLHASKELISGDFDFSMQVGSTQLRNSTQRKQEAMQLYQLLAQSPLVRQDDLIRRVAETFELVDVDRLFKTPEELQQAQEAQRKQAEEDKKLKVMTELGKKRMDVTKSAEKNAVAKEIAHEKNKVSILTEMLRQGSLKSANI